MFKDGRGYTPYTTGRRPWRSEPYEAPDADGTRAVKQKLFWFGVVVVMAFGILTLQLVRFQLINGDEYRARAENNRLREANALALRDRIRALRPADLGAARPLESEARS